MKSNNLKIILFLLLLVFINNSLFPQTFSGSCGLITNSGASITFNAEVSGLPLTCDSTFGLESITLNVTHHWVSKLDIKLFAPDGSFIDLFNGISRNDTNLQNTTLSNNSPISIFKAEPPYTGTFIPTGDPGIFNLQSNPNGIWKLYFRDTYPNYSQGELISWSLTFGDQPSRLRDFSSSDIPIIIVITDNQIIPDDPKIMAHMGIINHDDEQLNYITDPYNHYDGWIGIERRGSSAQIFPKRFYGFETWDASGNDINTSLLNMPEESDWILNAYFNDKSLIRSAMTYHLWGKMGHYATRNRYCQLVLDNQFTGTYLLLEKIKRDSQRVDIASLKPEDTTGIDLTGGYIIKIDKETGSGGEGWESSYLPDGSNQGQKIVFLYEYPSSEEIVAQQKTYIQNYIYDFETALYHFGEGKVPDYKQYIDVLTFIDYFIVNEISRNVDGYRLSTFMHKDKGGKLRMGPVWDYDLAWGNANYCEAAAPEGWAFEFGSVCPNDMKQIPFWWLKLLTDTLYVNQLKCRWQDLRSGIFSENHLFSIIDSVTNVINMGQQKNFEQWPVFGRYIWPIPEPFSYSYEEEIISLKQWISARVQWIDANLPGTCHNSTIEEKSHNSLMLNPNPAKDFICINSAYASCKILSIEIFNSSGVRIQSKIDVKYEVNNMQFILVKDFEPGLYFIRIETNKMVVTGKFYKL